MVLDSLSGFDFSQLKNIDLNYIKNFFTSVYKSRFKKERTNLLALDIGSSGIKAIEIGRKGKDLVLEKHAIIPLEEGCIEGHHIKSYSLLTDQLARFTQENGYTNYDVALIISGPQVVTQVLKVPAEFADHQLMTHIELEAEKYLPFKIEELAVDFDVLESGQRKENNIEVLLAAAKKDYVNEYINIIKAVDLNLKVIDVYGCVMSRLAKHVAPKQLSLPADDLVIAMIDIGKDILTVSIFKNEHQLYLKEQNLGGNELNRMIRAEHPINYEQAEVLKTKYQDPAIAVIIDKFKELIVMNVYQVIQFFYASAFADKITQVFILGGSAQLPGLDNDIEQKLEIPVHLLNPFIGIDTSKYPEEELSTQYAAACGLALRSYVE